MFNAFAPLLALVGIYFIFAVVAKAAKKTASVQKKASGTPAASAPESPGPQSAAEPQLREMQPTVRRCSRPSAFIIMTTPFIRAA